MTDDTRQPSLEEVTDLCPHCGNGILTYIAPITPEETYQAVCSNDACGCGRRGWDD
jgi:hypothetical protein